MRILKFAVCGGDESAVRLCRLLAADGHEVRAFGFDSAKIPEGVMRVGCPEGCFGEADAVILPMPAATDDGELNAPFCPRRYSAAEIIEKMPQGTLTVAGCVDVLPERAYIEDYSARPECAAGFAAIRAEGAIETALGGSDRTLCESRTLIVGAGLLPELLAPRLRGLGAGVTITARRESELTALRAQGFNTVRLDKLETDNFDIIFNTLKDRGLSQAQINAIPPDCLYIELSGGTAGGGVEAKNLPGKCAPETAAEHIRNAVYAILEEWNI